MGRGRVAALLLEVGASTSPVRPIATIALESGGDGGRTAVARERRSEDARTDCFAECVGYSLRSIASGASIALVGGGATQRSGTGSGACGPAARE